MKKPAYLMAALISVAAAATLNTGCGKKGSAEKVGESMDKAVDSVTN